MQMSATRHSSIISTELTASLASLGTGSAVLAVATCTGDFSGGVVCDESGNAASTIDPGSSEAAFVLVAVAITDSAAVTTSALATAASPAAGACSASGSSASAVRDGARRSSIGTAPVLVAIACGASGTSAAAARDGARRFSIGTAPVFSMPAEPKPASQATTQPARTTVPHNGAVTVGNRR